MCHHYRLQLTSQQLAEIFEVVRNGFGQTIEQELYPLQIGPVIRLNEHGDRELALLQWGLLPNWWKPTSKSPNRTAFQRLCFNARGETVHEKPTYRAAFRYRRCLIPVSQFQEKNHWFSLPSNSPFALAGLWEDWEQAGEIVQSYTIVTTSPHPEIQKVGHQRMPVILPDEAACRRWLSSDLVGREPLEELLVPYAGQLVSSFQPTVSKSV